MCHVLIKVICCNRSLKDSDMVYEPDNLTVPFEDVKKVGSAIEHVVEDVLAPQTTTRRYVRDGDAVSSTVKDIASLFDGKKKINLIIIIIIKLIKMSVSFETG